MFQVSYKSSMAILCIGFAVMLTACSTVREAELKASVPSQAIQEVEAKQRQVISQQLDLFSPDIYKQAVDKLDAAKESVKDQDDAGETMSLAAQAKALFEDVEMSGDKNAQVPAQIMNVRKAAVVAVGHDSKKLSKELFEVDDELRYETDDFTEELDNKEFTRLQKSYLNIEVKGVQNRELKTSRQVIEKAESEKASRLAPTTLKAAKRNLVAAENLIAANVNNPNAYEKNVKQANESAKLLHDVISKSREMGERISEKVALNLVYQDRKIGKLTSNIDDLEGSLSSATAEAVVTSDILARKSQDLDEASGEVRSQKAMNQARSEFSEDEAAVYQQGNQLIIRLKKIDFAPGSAELPGSSMQLLSKVDNVIKSIGAEKVLVQGHTDSTGSDQANMKLSRDRADSVAKYLRSFEKDLSILGEGLGESMPLATNNSKEGRALNRRVDIVLTVVE